MENWDGASDIGEEEILNSSFSSIVNTEEDVAPVNLPTESPDIRETLKVKKSLKAIMNKITLVKMATFVEPTKELQLVTILDIQLLVSAYKTDRAETFATFCKEVSRDNPNFRRQLLNSLQKDFEMGLSEEEEEKSSLGNIRFIGKL